MPDANGKENGAIHASGGNREKHLLSAARGVGGPSHPDEYEGDHGPLPKRRKAPLPYDDDESSSFIRSRE